jgi:putative intracellular protease/amidase/YHS domain-containing protein
MAAVAPSALLLRAVSHRLRQRDVRVVTTISGALEEVMERNRRAGSRCVVPRLAVGLLGLAVVAGAAERPGPLKPPPTGKIPVAFLLADGATMIDFAGPWEVFQDVMVPGRGDSLAAFELYTVAESDKPIRASGGMKIVPDYTFANAPAPKVVVVPAQSEPTEAARQWLRKTAPGADVVMSVCTGAYVLAEAGILDGLTATTHHGAYRDFARQYPKVKVIRGRRFVEHDRIATAGGLTSGIDLALRVVERYFGRPAAERTVWYMEYQSDGWRDPTGAANAAYASDKVPPGMTICPVCTMEVPEGHLTTEYAGHTYHFCGKACRDRFRADPKRYIEERPEH